MKSEFDPPTPSVTREILAVSELNRAVAELMQRSIPALWIRGEVSNFTRAASGHWYFTLKDPGAQVRAVMFRGRAQAVGFQPREGDRVEVRALASLYEPRGDFQLQVELMRRAGLGDLYQRFLQLKEKLRAEGLLEADRKRPVPPAPRCIGVVTSPGAAALRDVLATLARRAPHLPVVVYPTLVQGAEAPPAIVAALTVAARRRECDVLLLVRGGGSIEDLWAFNDERVARAVVASPIPVISGVGHETDFTIADFVADARAATPTAAATLAVADRAVVLRDLRARALRLGNAWEAAQRVREQRLDTAVRLLRSPAAYATERGEALASLASRLGATMRARLADPAHRLARVQSALRAPALAARGRDMEGLSARLARAEGALSRRLTDRLEALGHKLELVNPLGVLERGYAIVRRADGSVVREAGEVQQAEVLAVQLRAGRLGVRVETREPDEPAQP